MSPATSLEELAPEAAQAASAPIVVPAPPPGTPAASRPPVRLMRQYELVDRVRAYNPDVDEDLLNAAYVYAMQKHGAQTRASGDPYFSHPLQVAALLTELKLDDATIAAALLHDTIEDTDATHAEIERRFGREIAQLVDGLTKIKKLDLVSREAKQAENLRKLLLAVVEDVRVLLVKLADRLHNMRTLHYVPVEKRGRIAEETLEIYAPLAGRMGMQDMREELEDLCFSVLHPEQHAALVKRLDAMRQRNGPIVATIERDLAGRLVEQGIKAAVKGREKRPYSIFKKAERKGTGFEQLSDIIAFRVIVATLEECYRALGLVHTQWPLVPGRFKDYISTPKQNDYQSLHTTVIGPGRQRVELQIRTEEMHRVAEYGIAAHALYKDRSQDDWHQGAGLEGGESRAFAWLRRTISMLAEGDNPEEFLEHTKLELFQDQVFCFTPKGKVIALPRGANAIDFAYAVHTDVGNTAMGCRVNGRPAPLVSELYNGDEVAIITAPSQSPPAAWESLVRTGRARAAIRRATRAAVRLQYAGLGRQILERSFERVGRAYSADAISGALRRLARRSVEDVLTAVGRGEIKSADVLRAVYPDFRSETSSLASGHPAPVLDASWFRAGHSLRFRAAGSGSGEANAIPIRSLRGDLPVRFGAGGAVPGERIVGILTPGEAITVYPIGSPELAGFEDEPEHWYDVRWDVEPGSPERFPARLQVISINEPGTLAQIAQVVAEADGNIDNLTMKRRSFDMTEMTIDLEVYDIRHLAAITDGLRARKVVSDVQRVL